MTTGRSSPRLFRYTPRGVPSGWCVGSRERKGPKAEALVEICFVWTWLRPVVVAEGCYMFPRIVEVEA